MITIKKESTKEIPKKRENALANSCYSIVKNKKEAKCALEKSKRCLAIK